MPIVVNRLIVAVALLTLFPLSSTGQTMQEPEQLNVSGTLIVGLATKEGLLICADKRTYDPLRGALDTEVKIVELTPTAVFAWTGIPVFYEILSDRTPDQPSLRVAFSAVDVVKGYFLNNRFSNTNDFWRGLSLALKEQFEKFLYAWPFTSWPETGNPPDNALFQLAFFYTDSANVPGAVLIRLCYEKSIPPSISTSKSEIQRSSFTEVRPIILGDTAVYDEVLSGKDKRFDDIRHDKLMSRFLTDRPPIQTVSVNAALDFARKFIKTTSERAHLIESTPFHVGPTTDCGLLGYKNGFKWLGRD